MLLQQELERLQDTVLAKCVASHADVGLDLAGFQPASAWQSDAGIAAVLCLV